MSKPKFKVGQVVWWYVAKTYVVVASIKPAHCKGAAQLYDLRSAPFTQAGVYFTEVGEDALRGLFKGEKG